jgi:Ca-activated chloride channel family protein
MNSLLHAFGHSSFLLLLALLPVLGILEVLRVRITKRRSQRLGNVLLVNGLKSAAPRWRVIRRFAQLIAVVAVVAGMAGPQWGKDWNTALAPGRDLVAVLDMSRSMLAQDVLPNRFERARQALEELSHDLQTRGGHRLGLVAFAARAKEVCPLTHDYDFFRAVLSELDAANLPPELRPADDQPGSGTRIGAALRAAVEAQAPEAAGYQDILLLSDGDDPAHDDEWRLGAMAAKERGIVVHTIGIGDPAAPSTIPTTRGKSFQHGGRQVLTRLEEEPLEIIARATGGTYTPGRTNELPLGLLFHEHIEPAGTREAREDPLPSLRQHYAWFFGSGLAFLILDASLGMLGTAFSRPGAQSKPILRPRRSFGLAHVLVLMVAASLLLAAAPGPDPESLIRQGNEAFRAGDWSASLLAYAAAEETATDPGLVAFNKAAALYQLHRYRDAELNYRRSGEDADGRRRQRMLYGLANCLLLQAHDNDVSRLREAIQCYESCLEGPTPAEDLRGDATHNLELARILLARAKARKPGKQDSPEQESNDSKPPDGEAKKAHEDEELARGDGAGSEATAQAPMNLEGARESHPDRKAQAPGKGNLAPIPDEDTLTPLTPEDALDHLKEATSRIKRERTSFRATSIPATLPHVLDW